VRTAFRDFFFGILVLFRVSCFGFRAFHPAGRASDFVLMTEAPETPKPPPPEPAFAWTAPQRRALLAVLTVLCLGLGIRYACNPTFVSDPQPERPARYDDLADRVDPNTADLNTLTAIPNLGEKRAEAIIEFREMRARQHPGQPAFRVVEDLMAVRGIGSAMVDNLKPYLTFPTRPPETNPSSATGRR
jgi:competence ComEA-like helix-hairpin-helix protein